VKTFSCPIKSQGLEKPITSLDLCPTMPANPEMEAFEILRIPDSTSNADGPTEYFPHRSFAGRANFRYFHY